MRWALDASFVIDLLRGAPRAVALADALDAGGVELLLPAPVLFELRTGLYHKAGKARASMLAELLGALPVINFDEHAAEHAAQLQGDRLRDGRPMGTIDVQVVGICLAMGLGLVTMDQSFLEIQETYGIPVKCGSPAQHPG